MENTFGLIVQRERNKQGLSLAKLSSLLNNEIDPSYINRLEKEQKNPSFKVVCLLTTALNLDVREVFRAFGFENLITNYDEEAVFAIDEFIRLHKIKNPHNNQIISKEEQETLINIVHNVFELSQAELDLGQLSPLLKEIQKLRDIHLCETTEFIEVPFMNTTFTVDIKAVSAQNRSFDREKAIVAIQDLVSKKGTKLLDIKDGSITVDLNGESWLAQIKGERVTFITRKKEIIDI
ncbi:helix-turn-helix domain-containing protein [Robertmurraya siralis]|uniref:helix-turn-helix domain-containing protein n=1 Tax=Robertmurraya siralis TaxID=77777 RepID=UPI0014777E6D|nr:helix-turn-helix domain-containing protein [Robertmurraya siralis]